MPFERRYDVLVAGAGIAGVAAALECARAGRSVALVEKSILPGGLATSGLIYVYLPLCDGFGRQVTFGLAEELLHLSIRYGPGDVPDWRKTRGGAEHERYRVIFSPASFVLALDEVLIDAGLEVWFDTLIVDAFMKGDRIGGAEVETKSGRGRLLADVVIDATGDADVASRAGATCVEGTNWLAMWALMASMDSARKAVGANRGTSLMDMRYLGGYDDGRGEASRRRHTGLRAEDITNFVLESRKLLLDEIKAKHAAGVDRRDLYPLTLPAMPQYRMIRRIEGRCTLLDGQDGERFDDSIGLVSDWRRSGPVWEVPFGTLISREVKGLLCAGRCISSAGDAWEITRVIPPAALTGQAAGVAATLACERDTPPDALDVADIQQRMREKGIKLHADEL